MKFMNNSVKRDKIMKKHQTALRFSSNYCWVKLNTSGLNVVKYVNSNY